MDDFLERATDPFKPPIEDPIEDEEEIMIIPLLSDEEIKKLLPPDDGYSYYLSFGEAVAKAQRDDAVRQFLIELDKCIETRTQQSLGSDQYRAGMVAGLKQFRQGFQDQLGGKKWKLKTNL